MVEKDYILNPKFIKSSEYIYDCPNPDKPEYAFIGRSNVGKSSLINYLTNHSKLAQISSNPGKTQTINHYLIGNQWYLVDLPGYGYAKRSKSQREKFARVIRNYLIKRDSLVLIFVLVDASIPPQNIDMEFINWLGESELPFQIIFTKSDKSKKSEVENNIQAFKDIMGNDWDELPKMYPTSSSNKVGKEGILDEIFAWNEQIGETIYKNFVSKKKK